MIFTAQFLNIFRQYSTISECTLTHIITSSDYFIINQYIRPTAGPPLTIGNFNIIKMFSFNT